VYESSSEDDVVGKYKKKSEKIKPTETKKKP
jgi:hypothetical protein